MQQRGDRCHLNKPVWLNVIFVCPYIINFWTRCQNNVLENIFWIVDPLYGNYSSVNKIWHYKTQCSRNVEYLSFDQTIIVLAFSLWIDVLLISYKILYTCRMNIYNIYICNWLWMLVVSMRIQNILDCISYVNNIHSISYDNSNRFMALSK